MSSSLTALIETVINRILRLDPDTLARIGELDGKVIRLRIAGDKPFEIFVLPSVFGLRLRTQHDGAPDVTLAGDVPVFARYAMQRVAPDVTASGEIQISGDIDLGQRFQQLLKRIEIDWEDQASQVLGDVAAHQLGNALRHLGRWGQRSLRVLREDAVEYLQEESRLLPARSRLDAFRHDVEALRQETDRLESRVTRMREGVK
jgi:ubiquinone biosynthesis protein UbiJ